jgi:CRP-like cAMP-binding protein
MGSPIGPLSAQNSRPTSPSTSLMHGSTTTKTHSGPALGGAGAGKGHQRRTSGSSTTGLFSAPGDQPLSPVASHGHIAPSSSGDPNDPDAAKNEGEIAPGIVRVQVVAKGQMLGLCGLLSPQQVYLTTAVVHSPGTRVWSLPKSKLGAFLSKGKSGGEKQVRDYVGEKLLKALEGAAWLRSLPPSALVALASLFQATTVPSGTLLFSSGDCTADHSALYLLLHGQVACEVADERGKPVTRTVGPGQWVGELSVVVGLCRTGSARALTDLLVRYITRRSLFRFFQSFALLPIASSASRALLGSYPPLRDEQLLEQMNMQGAFARFCLKEFSAEVSCARDRQLWVKMD